MTQMLFLGADTKEKKCKCKCGTTNSPHSMSVQNTQYKQHKIRLQGPTFVIGVPNKMVTEGINTFIFHQKGELLIFFFQSIYVNIY